MTDLPHSEEKYPLLFLFLEDGNKANRKGRGLFFERTRSNGIMSGATAVFTQWPGYLSSCGLTTIILVISIMFLVLLIFASMLKPMELSLHPRCLNKRSKDSQNTNLFLVHTDDQWQQNQLDALEEIVTRYTQCDIELILLRSDENSTSSKQNESDASGTFHYDNRTVPRKKRQANEYYDSLEHVFGNKTRSLDMNITVGAQALLMAFMSRRRMNSTLKDIKTTITTPLPSIPTIDDLIAKFPRIIVRNLTYEEFFTESPLYSGWKNLNKHVLIFAARVIRLWDVGGISFELPESVNVKPPTSAEYFKYGVNHDNSSVTKVYARTLAPIEENKIIKNMINIGYDSFESLPEGLVTVDEEGVHMETKTTCHAFFGEALTKLRMATLNSTVPGIIQQTLKTFCDRGAVDLDYCNSIKS